MQLRFSDLDGLGDAGLSAIEFASFRWATGEKAHSPGALRLALALLPGARNCALRKELQYGSD